MSLSLTVCLFNHLTNNDSALDDHLDDSSTHPASSRASVASGPASTAASPSMGPSTVLPVQVLPPPPPRAMSITSLIQHPASGAGSSSGPSSHHAHSGYGHNAHAINAWRTHDETSPFAPNLSVGMGLSMSMSSLSSYPMTSHAQLGPEILGLGPEDLNPHSHAAAAAAMTTTTTTSHPTHQHNFYSSPPLNACPSPPRSDEASLPYATHLTHTHHRFGSTTSSNPDLHNVTEAWLNGATTAALDDSPDLIPVTWNAVAGIGNGNGEVEGSYMLPPGFGTEHGEGGYGESSVGICFSFP